MSSHLTEKIVLENLDNAHIHLMCKIFHFLTITVIRGGHRSHYDEARCNFWFVLLTINTISIGSICVGGDILLSKLLDTCSYYWTLVFQ
jgi:hypothetical protein